MSSIHYFPRYSQKENMVTNNTLLLFSRLYNNSPEKFMRFINSVLEESGMMLDTTVQFNQQQKSTGGTIPDGSIQQESFKIVIETKLYGQEYIKQIIGHWNAFKKEDKQIFLWINREPISKEYKKEIISSLNQFNDSHDQDIGFASTTFRNICRCYQDILQEYDLEMKGLVDDYEAFCNETGLIDNTDNKIRVVLTGQTFQQNMEHRMYFHPTSRGYQNTRFIGLYQDKAMRGIGKVTDVVDVIYNPDSQELNIVKVIQGTIDDDKKATMKKVTVESKKLYGYADDEQRRFFFVEQYYPTNYVKASKGGLMGNRYIDLTEVHGYDEKMTASEIAVLLNGKIWEIG